MAEFQSPRTFVIKPAFSAAQNAKPCTTISGSESALIVYFQGDEGRVPMHPYTRDPFASAATKASFVRIMVSFLSGKQSSGLHVLTALCHQALVPIATTAKLVGNRLLIDISSTAYALRFRKDCWLHDGLFLLRLGAQLTKYGLGLRDQPSPVLVDRRHQDALGVSGV